MQVNVILIAMSFVVSIDIHMISVFLQNMRLGIHGRCSLSMLWYGRRYDHFGEVVLT